MEMAHFGIIDGRQDPCKARTLTRCYTKKTPQTLEFTVFLIFCSMRKMGLEPTQAQCLQDP